MATQPINDLRKLAEEFSEISWPDMPCPACNLGGLEIKSDKPIIDEQLHLSRWEQDEHPDWEPDWIRGYFHGVLRCAREACKEVVVVSGKYRVDVVDGGPHEWQGDQYGDYFRVMYFIPALPLVRANEKFPESVLKLIDAGSAVLWTDPGSAANRVRSAIEELLTLQRVPKSFVDKKGKRQRISLHGRIEQFAKVKPKYADAAEVLKAVKYIGNDGSHGDGLEVGDVLDGVELLNHALELIYDTSAADLKRKAAQINKRKGVPRKRTATTTHP
jgi:hypothetical protein